MLRVLVLCCLVGCVPLSYAFTPASSRGVTPKPENCTFEVVTSTPDYDFEEVGTLDHYNGKPPKDLAVFETAVHSQVCSAGGEAVIAIRNDKGEITKGTIIKRPQRFTP